MVNFALAEAYSFLEGGTEIPERLCSQLLDSAAIADECAVSLSLRLLKQHRSQPELLLMSSLLQRSPNVRELVSSAYPAEANRAGVSSDCRHYLHSDDQLLVDQIRNRRDVGPTLIRSALTRFLDGSMPPPTMALLLTLVAIEGMSDPDIAHLTTAMTNSGQVFDYRGLAIRQGRRIVRRYPTGGVSEKVSLILPSLLLAMSDEVSLLSTMFVGRSLGFTGGTWDKLGAIPGFAFSEPGAETEEMLASHRVVMCTTGAAVNPADRELYSLRSKIGTIASVPLIVSSISSKHLAIPAHRLLLDVRYGKGAFMKTPEEAQEIGKRISEMLEDADLRTTFLLSNTEVMTGAAIGNTLEVAEALAVMGALPDEIDWMRDELNEQREVVVTQATDLLSAEFGEVRAWGCSARENIASYFDNGQVLRSFNLLLKAHGVAPDLADEVCGRPCSLIKGVPPKPILAPADGFICGVDQVSLGNCVNFVLRGEKRAEPGWNRSGVVLRKRLGSAVKAGEPLALAFAEDNVWKALDRTKTCDLLADCFSIGPDFPTTARGYLPALP